MRERILKAASQLFVEKGYKKTTLKDIVEKAGTSIGNCYFYYKNKEAILAAIIVDKFDKRNQVVQDIIEKCQVTDLIDKISIMVYSYSLDLLKNQDNIKLYIMSSSFPEIRAITSIKIKEHFDGLRNLDQEAYKDIFNEEFLEYLDILPILYKSIFLGLSESLYLGEVKRELEDVLEFIVKWILKSLGIKKERVIKNFEYLKTLNIQSMDEIIV